MAKNVTIARLNTLVTANAAQFTKELDKASSVAKSRGGAINRSLSKIGSSLSLGNLAGSLGVGLSVGAVFSYGNAIMDLGGKITDLSAVADLPARKFQALSILAGDSGVSMEEVAKASETMRQRLQDARTNATDPLNKSLASLNMSAAGLSVLSTGEKWEVVSQKLAVAKDRQEAMNLVSELFGTKIGPKLRTTLDEVAGGIDKAASKMPGLILKDRQIEALDRVGDRFARLGRFALVFGAGVLDGATSFGELNDMVEANIPLMAKLGNFQRSVMGKKKSLVPDITTPGEYVLPGGSRKFKSLDERTKEERDSRMAEADNKAKLEEQLKEAEAYAEKLEDAKAKGYQRAVAKAKVMLKKDATAEGKRKENEQFQASRSFVPNTPTDAYSRIGLMTGERGDNEQKRQTNLLKEINTALQRMASRGGQSAAFAN